MRPGADFASASHTSCVYSTHTSDVNTTRERAESGVALLSQSTGDKFNTTERNVYPTCVSCAVHSTPLPALLLTDAYVCVCVRERGGQCSVQWVRVYGRSARQGCQNRLSPPPPPPRPPPQPPAPSHARGPVSVHTRLPCVFQHCWGKVLGKGGCRVCRR